MILKSRRLIQKFLILGILLGCLGVVSTERGTNAAGENFFKPCCSVCDPDPTIPICRFGCNPGC